MKLVALAGIVCACAASLAAGITQNGMKVDPATTGTVSGRVIFDGVPRARAKLRVDANPYCLNTVGPTVLSEAVVTGDRGALRNVFVYVKDGLDKNYSFDLPPAVAMLDQHGCQFAPHVMGVQVGQPLVIVNSDATLHNVHGHTAANQPFNIGQPMAGMRSEFTFTKEEVMIPLKSDIHSWMSAYVGVLPHPFFAVSGDDGSFTIGGVPSGSYVIEAWHETLGTTSEQVVVNAGQTSSVSFTFSSRAAR